jgi:pimeloyl-ACP methyl ester carboxylesterase
VLWGEKDIYLEKTVNTGLEKFVENVRVVYFPKNSHWIIHEIPETISKYIEDFSKAN